MLARLAGDFARAQPFAEEGIAVGRATSSPRAVVTCLNVLTTIAGLAGDFDGARAHCDEAVTLARSMGSRRIEAIALFILAEAALHTRRYSDVQEAGGRAFELSRSIDDHEGMALALSRLGMCAMHEGRLEDASSQLGEALEHAARLGFPGIGAVCAMGSRCVRRLGDWARAARLLGAAEALRRASGSLLARRSRCTRGGACGDTPDYARSGRGRRARGRPPTEPGRGARRSAWSVRIWLEALRADVTIL